MTINLLVIIVIIETLLLVLSPLVFYSRSRTVKELSDSLASTQPPTKYDFLPLLIHELRAPLSIIKGSSDLILKNAAVLSQEQIETLLTQIKGSSNRLLQLVNDMLDISKLETGMFEVEMCTVKLNALISEEAEYFMTLAKEKNITIGVDLDKSIDDVTLDPERIKQVLTNLLSNAIKFSDNGNKIIVSSRKASNGFTVGVADFGVGVSDDLKPRLFHKFVQGHNHKNGFNHDKGTGLGLAICKGIVEAHHGKIWIEDNHPTGTKFLFSIPAIQKVRA